MKASPQFETIIQAHLQSVGAKDKAFQAKLDNPKKNINDCITYILNTVKKSGCSGFADDEIFGMAKHYYDEKNIDIGGKISAKNVIVNHRDDRNTTPIKSAHKKKPISRKEPLEQLSMF